MDIRVGFVILGVVIVLMFGCAIVGLLAALLQAPGDWLS